MCITAGFYFFNICSKWLCLSLFYLSVIKIIHIKSKMQFFPPINFNLKLCICSTQTCSESLNVRKRPCGLCNRMIGQVKSKSSWVKWRKSEQSSDLKCKWLQLPEGGSLASVNWNILVLYFYPIWMNWQQQRGQNNSCAHVLIEPAVFFEVQQVKC